MNILMKQAFIECKRVPQRNASSNNIRSSGFSTPNNSSKFGTADTSPSTNIGLTLAEQFNSISRLLSPGSGQSAGRALRNSNAKRDFTNINAFHSSSNSSSILRNKIPIIIANRQNSNLTEIKNQSRALRSEHRKKTKNKKYCSRDSHAMRKQIKKLSAMVYGVEQFQIKQDLRMRNKRIMDNCDNHNEDHIVLNINEPPLSEVNEDDNSSESSLLESTNKILEVPNFALTYDIFNKKSSNSPQQIHIAPVQSRKAPVQSRKAFRHRKHEFLLSDNKSKCLKNMKNICKEVQQNQQLIRDYFHDIGEQFCEMDLMGWNRPGEVTNQNSIERNRKNRKNRENRKENVIFRKLKRGNCEKQKMGKIELKNQQKNSEFAENVPKKFMKTIQNFEISTAITQRAYPRLINNHQCMSMPISGSNSPTHSIIYSNRNLFSSKGRICEKVKRLECQRMTMRETHNCSRDRKQQKKRSQKSEVANYKAIMTYF